MSDRHEHGDLFDPPIQRAGGQITRGLFPPNGTVGADLAGIQSAAVDRVRDGAAAALKVHRAKNRHTIATVRAMALALYYRLGRPISVNDIRQDWDAIGPLSADPRAIGAVFASNDWRKVGRVETDSPNSNRGRTVATFVPSCVPLDDPREGPLALAFCAGWNASHRFDQSSPRGEHVTAHYLEALDTYLREVK